MRPIASSRAQFGEPLFERIDAAATPAQKKLLANLKPEQVKSKELAGGKIQSILTRAPGNDASIGGLKVVADGGWFAARPSGTEDVYKIYAESYRGADHLKQIQAEAQAIVTAALESVTNPDDPPTEHRRRGQRMAAAMWVRLSSSGTELGMGHLANVSISGAFLETKLKLPVNANITLEPISTAGVELEDVKIAASRGEGRPARAGNRMARPGHAGESSLYSGWPFLLNGDIPDLLAKGDAARRWRVSA